MLVITIKRIVFAALIVLAQISVVPNLGRPAALADLMLVSLVFIGMINGFSAAMIYALIFGFAQDLTAGLFFPSWMLIYAITIILIGKIYLRFFTNKSFYSILLLVILASVFSHYLLNLAQLIFDTIKLGELNWQLLISRPDFIELLIAAAVNSAIAGLLYVLFFYLSNKFHSLIIK